MPKLYVILSVLGLVAFVAASTSAQEDLTLTTYYPAPYGVYNQMVTKTLGVGDTDGDGDLDSDDAPDTTSDPNELWVAGDVGIGTTNPQGRLTVYSTANTNDYTDGITLHSNSGGVNSYFYHNTGEDLIIRKASISDQLVLDTGGNVGIGTTSPEVHPTDPSGNLDVNDVYLRSTSSWLSAAARFGVWNDWDNDGSPEPISSGVSYYAATDGIVCAKSGFNRWIQGFTDENNPPVTERVYVAQRDVTGQGNTSITMPVRKGDYWKVEGQGNDVDYIYWMPVGN